MPKTVHFISGLPRSGSTLLANLLAQNPRFHSTATSGLLEILYTTKNRFWDFPQFRAMPESEIDKKIANTLKGAMQGYYGDVEAPVVFDKARGWEGHIEMAEAILGQKPKIICCVRNVLDVLASLELLYRNTVSTRQLPDEKNFPVRMRTLPGRVELWLANDGGIVGAPVNMIRDAVARGHRDCIYFCEYERLTSNPSKVTQELYEFLGEEEFKHNFKNVEQVTAENDLMYVFKDLHKIRSEIKPQEPRWPAVIPEAIARGLLPEARFWTSL